MRRKHSTSIAEISRKLSRALELGKGVGLDAETLSCLAAIGVFDLIQQKSAEYLREQGLQRSMAAGTRMPSPPRFNITAGGTHAGAAIVSRNSRQPESARAPEPHSEARQYARKQRSNAPGTESCREQFLRMQATLRPDRGKER